jgi:hypothetical protein
MTQPNMATIQSHLFVAAGLERLETTYQLDFKGRRRMRSRFILMTPIHASSVSIPNLSAGGWSRNPNGMRSLSLN